jgi:hypothetical protein
MPENSSSTAPQTSVVRLPHARAVQSRILFARLSDIVSKGYAFVFHVDVHRGRSMQRGGEIRAVWQHRVPCGPCLSEVRADRIAPELGPRIDEHSHQDAC